MFHREAPCCCPCHIFNTTRPEHHALSATIYVRPRDGRLVSRTKCSYHGVHSWADHWIYQIGHMRKLLTFHTLDNTVFNTMLFIQYFAQSSRNAYWRLHRCTESLESFRVESGVRDSEDSEDSETFRQRDSKDFKNSESYDSETLETSWTVWDSEVLQTSSLTDLETLRTLKLRIFEI